jgi:hypothetical protein
LPVALIGFGVAVGGPKVRSIHRPLFEGGGNPGLLATLRAAEVPVSAAINRSRRVLPKFMTFDFGHKMRKQNPAGVFQRHKLSAVLQD